MGHISQKLLDELDAAVGRAIERVESGEVARCGVTFTVIVGYDKHGALVVKAANKDSGSQPHSWYPTPSGQQAFAEFSAAVEADEGIDSVTFSTPGREPVTLGRKGREG